MGMRILKRRRWKARFERTPDEQPPEGAEKVIHFVERGGRSFMFLCLDS